MRILVSNDDGYFAPGITLLAEALRQLGEVTVVAPERDRSGASNSLTLDRPLTVRAAPNGYFSVNGTPTDCVHIAVTGLLDFTPDMVVSGHQPRRQHGRRHHLFRHGRRGHRGLPARHSVDRDVAHQQGRRAFRERDRRRAADRRALRRAPFGEPVLLNVNVPDVPPAELRGIEVTRLGKRHKAEPVVKMTDAARRDRVLDRPGGRRGRRRPGHRFPRGRERGASR